MQQKQAGISQQTAYDLLYLTTAASIKCLLPDPAFKDLCLKAVVAVCLHRNECEMCCHVSGTSCLPQWLIEAFRLCSRVFPLQRFSVFSKDWAVTLACVFTSLFLQGWLKIFSTLRTIFSVKRVSKAIWIVSPQTRQKWPKSAVNFGKLLTCNLSDPWIQRQ